MSFTNINNFSKVENLGVPDSIIEAYFAESRSLDVAVLTY